MTLETTHEAGRKTNLKTTDEGSLEKIPKKTREIVDEGSPKTTLETNRKTIPQTLRRTTFLKKLTLLVMKKLPFPCKKISKNQQSTKKRQKTIYHLEIRLKRVGE